jgi:hypothetical protein
MVQLNLLRRHRIRLLSLHEVAGNEPVVLFLAAQPTGGRLTGVGAGLTLRRIVQ